MTSPRLRPTTTAADTTNTTKETTVANPADDYLSTMLNQANERLGHIIHAAIRAVFDADGFPWHRDATRQAIADAIRQLPDAADLADGIAQVICTVYTDQDHPHDPGAVRRAVTRHLAAPGPHGDRPTGGTSW